MSSKARRLYPRLHDDPEETKLRAAQSRPRPFDEWNGSDLVYSGCRPQSSGALDRARERRPGEGSPRSALSSGTWRSRRRRSAESTTGPVEIRGEARQGRRGLVIGRECPTAGEQGKGVTRSEEHTSELQSLAYLVCRLLL